MYRKDVDSKHSGRKADGRAAVPKGGAVTDYDLLCAQLEGLLAGESDPLANAANFASFVYHELPELNWAGFYFNDEAGDLVLGPFNGRPACTRLPFGRGVCGAAFTRGETVVVDNVNSFGDHIVCDSASQSEIVVPLRDDAGLYGVFDIDSPIVERFTEVDRRGIERLVAIFLNASKNRRAAVAHRSR
jgi:GAF domain-containing protein